MRPPAWRSGCDQSAVGSSTQFTWISYRREAVGALSGTAKAGFEAQMQAPEPYRSLATLMVTLPGSPAGPNRVPSGMPVMGPETAGETQWEAGGAGGDLRRG